MKTSLYIQKHLLICNEMHKSLVCKPLMSSKENREKI